MGYFDTPETMDEDPTFYGFLESYLTLTDQSNVVAMYSNFWRDLNAMLRGYNAEEIPVHHRKTVESVIEQEYIEGGDFNGGRYNLNLDTMREEMVWHLKDYVVDVMRSSDDAAATGQVLAFIQIELERIRVNMLTLAIGRMAQKVGNMIASYHVLPEGFRTYFEYNVLQAMPVERRREILAIKDYDYAYVFCEAMSNYFDQNSMPALQDRRVWKEWEEEYDTLKYQHDQYAQYLTKHGAADEIPPWPPLRPPSDNYYYGDDNDEEGDNEREDEKEDAKTYNAGKDEEMVSLPSAFEVTGEETPSTATYLENLPQELFEKIMMDVPNFKNLFEASRTLNLRTRDPELQFQRDIQKYSKSQMSWVQKWKSMVTTYDFRHHTDEEYHVFAILGMISMVSDKADDVPDVYDYEGTKWSYRPFVLALLFQSQRPVLFTGIHIGWTVIRDFEFIVLRRNAENGSIVARVKFSLENPIILNGNIQEKTARFHLKKRFDIINEFTRIGRNVLSPDEEISDVEALGGPEKIATEVLEYFLRDGALPLRHKRIYVNQYHPSIQKLRAFPSIKAIHDGYEEKMTLGGYTPAFEILEPTTLYDEIAQEWGNYPQNAKLSSEPPYALMVLPAPSYFLEALGTTTMRKRSSNDNDNQEGTSDRPQKQSRAYAKMMHALKLMD